MPETSWLALPSFPSLADDEVHVWRVWRRQSAEAMSSLWRTLSMDEREKAERFRFGKDRETYVATRGALRSILGGYLGLAPDDICFSYSAYGKPALDVAVHPTNTMFNVSHSHDLALIAVTLDSKIGVDVEMVRSDMAGDEIAQRFFAPSEIATLRSLPEQQQTEAFFHCWTRKEAFVKAVGEGLSYPLDQFEVSLTSGKSARLVGIRGGRMEAERWSLYTLTPGAGFVAAVAVEARERRLLRWQWHATLSRWRNDVAAQHLRGPRECS